MRHYPIVIFALTGLTACSDRGKQDSQTQQTLGKEVQIVRKQDPAQLQRGYQLFSQNCATCHGSHAEGAPNWSQPDASGKYPAPPLNGTGHAWHHPQQALINTIKHGTTMLGGSMPAWQGKLSDQDIHDIIAWFQSQWPDELYAAWQHTDQAAQQSRR